MKSVLFVLLLASVWTYVKCQFPYSIELETELRNRLYGNYTVLQRPSQTVNVRLSFTLITINYLDIKSQTLSTSGYFGMVWRDERLEWNTLTDYDNVRFIFSNEKYTWIPAIVITNSASDLVVFSDPQSLIRIIQIGTAFWSPGGVFQTHCEADVTYYPLDTQDCYIALSTWAYTSREVFLDLENEPLILDDFKENGEWEIIETSTTSDSRTREGGANSYSRIKFHIKLRRRPLFHILNTLFPVMLMSCLIICVFKLPPESGERVGLSLTVLLAYTVYLTLISENIPQTSVSASILSTYLTIILMLSALSVIFTVIVLDIYFNHEDDEEIPSWLQSFTRVVLVRISCWKDHGCCSSKKANKVDNAVVDISYPVKPAKNVKKGSANIDETTQENDEDKNDVKIYSWKEIARILDKCFMYLFIFMVITVTSVCLSIMAIKY